jgi:glycosyl transferase family 25
MSPLNALFDKIFVLTIERNKDRHPAVKQNLKGIDFEFWYGIDVPKLFPHVAHVIDMPDEFFVENEIDKSSVSVMTRGQLGAYTSIKQMINEVQDKYQSVLIFEDDFFPLRDDWQTILQSAYQELPREWDILLAGYLYYGRGYQMTYTRNRRWLFNLYNSSKKLLGLGGIVKPIPKTYSEHLDKSGTGLGGHAYCISKQGAGKLMRYLTPMKESGDVLIKKLIEQNLLNAYSVYPCLFEQNKSFGSKTELS